jgi:hypothetical protein
VMIVVGPILLLVTLALAFAFAVVLAVPLVPLAMVAVIVWALVKATNRPAALA